MGADLGTVLDMVGVAGSNPVAPTNNHAGYESVFHHSANPPGKSPAIPGNIQWFHPSMGAL